MSKIIEAPELFSDPKAITLGRGERLIAVSVPVSPEGVYTGNGEYKTLENEIFRVIGFDRSNGREFWIGRAYIRTTQGY